MVTEVAAAGGDRFPPLAPVRRALFSPVAARVDGRAINAALAHGAQRRGARLLGPGRSGWSSGHPGPGVETAAGRVDSGAVVLAGGAWTRRLTESLGPPWRSDR